MKSISPHVRMYGIYASGAMLTASLTLAGCEKKGSAAPQQGAPEVAVVTVTPEPYAMTIELPGRASAFLVADVRPQVNGLILKRLFEEGSEVQAGQELYQMDPAPFEAALNTAQAALNRTEAQLPALRSKANRIRQALADRAVSQQDSDDADAALKQAEADTQYWKATVQTARINLGYARIVSPISGRIGKSSVTEGAIVTAYQPAPLATIQQMDPIYVDVPESTAALQNLKRRLGAGHLRRDDSEAGRVRLILDDGMPYPLEGHLQFQDVSVDPTTSSVMLRTVFPNPKGEILPGMFVQTVVREGVHPQAILIPQQAVLRDPRGNPVVLIVNASGKTETRSLTLGQAVGNRWLVTSGVQPGDRVIVEGATKVRSGDSVRAVPCPDATKPEGSTPPPSSATR